MSGRCYNVTQLHTAVRCPDFSPIQQLVLYVPAVCFFAPCILLFVWYRANLHSGKYKIRRAALWYLLLGGLFAFVIATLDERSHLDADVSRAIGWLSGFPISFILAAMYTLSPTLPHWLETTLFGLASNMGLLNDLAALLEVKHREGRPTFADREGEQHTLALNRVQLALGIVFCALLAPAQARTAFPGLVIPDWLTFRKPLQRARSPSLEPPSRRLRVSHQANNSSSSDEGAAALRRTSVRPAETQSDTSDTAASQLEPSAVYVRACAAASLGATTLFVIVSIMLLVRSTGFAVQLAASMLNALGFVLLCVACYLDAVRARSSEAPMDLEALQRQHSADPFKRSPIRTVASASTLRSRTASPRSSGAESAGISRIDRVAYLLHGTAAKQHRPLSESPPPQGPPESPTTQRTGLYAASLAGDKRLAPELVLPPLRRAVSTPLRGSLYEKPKTDTSPYSFLDVKTADFGRTRTSSKNSNVSAGAVSLLRLRRSIAQLGTVFRSHAAMPSSPTECHAAIDEAHSAAYSSQSLLRSVDTCSSTAHRQNSTRSASTAASWERFSWREDSMSCKRDSCMPWADAAERMMELPVRAVSASDEHGHQAWRLSAISDATFPARIGGALELDVGDISDVETPVRQDESAPAGYFSGRSPLESTSVAAATQPQTDRSSSQRWRSERRPSTPLALDVFNSNPRSPKSHTRSASLGHLDDLALSMSDAVFAVEPLAIPSTAMTRSRDAVSSWSEAMPHHPLRIPPSPRRKPVPAYLDLPLRSLSPPWMLPGQNADRPHFAAPIASAPPTGSSIMQQRQHLPALVAPSPTRPHAHKLVVEHDGSAAEPEQQPSRLASPRRTTCLSRSSCEEDAHAYCTAALLFGGRKPSGLASS